MRHLKIFIFIFPIIALAEPAQVERVYRYPNLSGQEVRTVVRDISINGTTSQTGFRQTSLFIGQTIQQTATTSFYHDNQSSQSAPVIESRRTTIDRQINDSFASDNFQGGSASINVQTDMPISPDLGKSLNGNDTNWHNPSNPDYFYRQAQEAQRQYNLDQQQILGKKMEANADLARGYLAISSVEALSTSNDLVRSRFPQNVVPRLAEIKMNAEAQKEEILAFKAAQTSGNFARAATLIAELSSPLLTSKTAETLKWITSQHDKNLQTEMVPHFKSPELENDRNTTLKLLDFSLTAKPQMSNPRGEAWVRASLYLIQAAALAQSNNDVARASLLLSEANTIARFLAGMNVASGISISSNNLFESSATPIGQTYQETTPDKMNQVAQNMLLNGSGSSDGLAQIVAQLKKTASPDSLPYLALASQALAQQATLGSTPQVADMIKQVVLLSTDIAVGLKGQASLDSVANVLLNHPIDGRNPLEDFQILASLPALATEAFYNTLKGRVDVALSGYTPKEREEVMKNAKKVVDGLAKLTKVDNALNVFYATTGRDLAGTQLSNAVRTEAIIKSFIFMNKIHAEVAADRYRQLFDGGNEKFNDLLNSQSGKLLPDGEIPPETLQEVEQGLTKANLRAHVLGIDATALFGGMSARGYQMAKDQYDRAQGAGSFEKAYGDNVYSSTFVLTKTPDKINFVRLEDDNMSNASPILPRWAIEGHTLKEIAQIYGDSIHPGAITTVTPIDLRNGDVISVASSQKDFFEQKGNPSELGSTIRINNPEPRMFNRSQKLQVDADGRLRFENLEGVHP
jgi:hypothetical protein